MAQVLNVRVPDEMKERLEEEAKKDERSVAFIVRIAIQKYFESIDKEKKEEN